MSFALLFINSTDSGLPIPRNDLWNGLQRPYPQRHLYTSLGVVILNEALQQRFALSCGLS